MSPELDKTVNPSTDAGMAETPAEHSIPTTQQDPPSGLSNGGHEEAATAAARATEPSANEAEASTPAAPPTATAADSETAERIADMVKHLPLSERARVNGRLKMLQSWERQGRRFLPLIVKIMGR